MKRKRFDLRDWHRVARGEQQVTHVPAGLIVDFTAHEVNAPLDVPFGERTIRVLDSGYRWVRLHPYQGQPTTAMLDAQGQVVQLYVDIAEGGGLDPDGLPWHHDLYLDVIADLDDSGRVTAAHIIDAEDLQSALNRTLILQAQFEYAWRETEAVRASLLAGTFPQLDALKAYLRGPGAEA